METFPLPYTFDVTKDVTYATTTVTFASQKKQVQQNAVNPMVKWKIQCKGDNDQRQTLELFHGRMAGNVHPFYFYDENNVQQTVRFSDQGLSIKLLREFSTTQVTHGNVVGFTAEVTVEVAL